MRTNSLLLRAGTAATAALLVLAGCSSNNDSSNKTESSSSTADDSIHIDGDMSNPVNTIAAEAISDLQSYWTTEYPEVYGSDYTPVAGGFFAVVPSSGQLPPCAAAADEIAGNAFYCPSKDVVAWDAEGLLPDLRERFGDFVIPIVLAHEWGHAVQARAKFEGLTVTKEIQADCFAGAWTAHALKEGKYKVDDADLDEALAGFLFLRDEPGTESEDPNAHGSGFDRVNSFQTGFDAGAMGCKGYKDGEPPVIELPFNSAADAQSGGDAPYTRRTPRSSTVCRMTWRTTGRSCTPS